MFQFSRTARAARDPEEPTLDEPSIMRTTGRAVDAAVTAGSVGGMIGVGGEEP